MTENESSSWGMKNTMDLDVPRGEAKFVLMCINLNYKNNSHFIHKGHKHLDNMFITKNKLTYYYIQTYLWRLAVSAYYHNIQYFK